MTVVKALRKLPFPLLHGGVREGTTPFLGGARGVMVIVAGYGHGDTSSNPGQDWLHFT